MSIEYKHMYGDDPVSFGFDKENSLIVARVTREAIEDCFEIHPNEKFSIILKQYEVKIAESLASWIETERPKELKLQSEDFTRVMKKYSSN